MHTSGRIVSAFILLFLPSYPRSSTLQVDFCRLYGSVFVTDSPRYADFRVYVEESDAFCDIIVYKTENRLFADRPGLWHITKTRGFEDFSVYFEKDRGLADFTVHFTDTESFARCNK